MTWRAESSIIIHETSHEISGVFHWHKAKCQWVVRWLYRSGLWASVDVPYWGKKQQQKGWVSLLRLQCKSYTCKKAYIPIGYSGIKWDWTICHLLLKVKAIFTCTKYESAHLHTVWCLPTAGPTSKQELNLDDKILWHVGVFKCLKVVRVLGPVSHTGGISCVSHRWHIYF